MKTIEQAERDASAPAAHQHANEQKRLARQDGDAARTRVPTRRTLSVAQHSKLRALARQVFELELRNRARSAALETSRRFIQTCREQLRKLEPELSRAQEHSHRTRGSDLHGRYASELALIEERIARLTDDVAHMSAEMDAIAAEQRELVTVIAPLRTTVDRACRHLNADRAALGIDFGLLELQRLGPADIVL